MDKSTIVTALRAINNVLSRKGQHETLVVIGGAALALSYSDFDRPIKDVDGVWVSGNLMNAVEEVTYELDLPSAWFHDAAGSPEQLRTVTLMSNLEVKAPSKDYLLCMKLRSGRTAEKAPDIEDVKFLIQHMPQVTSPADWQKMYVEFFKARDWHPWVADAANQAIEDRDESKVASLSTSNPSEPLLTSTINSGEWRYNDNMDVTHPGDVKKVVSANEDDEDAYWGSSGAGVVFYCPETQRVLLPFRSSHVLQPNCWGVWGGRMEEGESPEATALREAHEEAGKNLINVEHVWDYHDKGFTYYNFVGIVHDEFKPVLNWETAGYQWCSLNDPPYPLHFGLQALWPHLQHWLHADAPDSFDARDQGASLVEQAREWAAELFAGDTRRGSDTPYFEHLEGVALMVAGTGGNAIQQAAAYLHDTIEDGKATAETIQARFGPEVAQLVIELTRVSSIKDGNRTERKAIDRNHYAHISPLAQSIKLADIIYNGYDAVKNDPVFAKTYIPELQQLVSVLTQGSSVLHHRAEEMLTYAFQHLNG